MHRGRRCVRSLSSGWRAADTGGAQEAFETAEAHTVGSGEGSGGGAVTVCGDQVGDVALIKAVAQAPRTLRARSRGTYGTDERRGVAKPQVSGLYRVRVSGKYLHSGCSRSIDLGIHAFAVCESLLFRQGNSHDPDPAGAV
jgi:hypothetical protein